MFDREARFLYNFIMSTGKSEPLEGKEAAAPRKSDLTRERILQAARKVFADNSYKAASIRMIGKTGGFDHPLIHYYFPSKAELFEAVIEDICAEFHQAYISWFEGLESQVPAKALPVFIERLLDYNLENPEALRMIMQNVGQIDRLEEIPGYQHIPRILEKNRMVFDEKVNHQESPEKLSMFINSFNSLVIYYLGANSCQAEALGMDAQSNEYREWVKDTLLYIFLPRLEDMVFGEKTKSGSSQ